jgi:hypothetical protein
VSNPPNLPTVNTVPNTTTDIEFVDYESSVSESVFDPRQDIGENVFDPGQTFNGPATDESVFDPRQDVGESVFDPGQTFNGPATDESVFDPRQDVGESVFDPGATFNGPATEESVFDPRQDVGESVFDPGQTFNGPATEESVFDPRQDVGENVFDPGAALPNPAVTAAAQLNDPYAGLTPKQLQELGGADPTDPYIRARLGIPQLVGSILVVTAGFGSIKTGVKALDSALGIIRGLGVLDTLLGGGAGGGQGLSSLFTNFSSTVGGLFGSKPTASAVASTTGTGVAGIEAPAATPATEESVFDPRQDVGENVFDPGQTFNGPATEESVFDPRQDVGENVFDPGQTFNGPATEESVFDPRQDVGENVFDPGATFNGPATEESVFDPRQDVGENVFDPGQTFNGPATEESVFDPRQDVGENVFDPGATFNGPATKDTPVNPASDPSQFPAYDDDGNLQPGFRINDETGDTYYQGFARTDSAVTKSGTTTGLPVLTPDTAAIAQDAAKLRVQDPALTDDEDQNLQNVVGAQTEIVRAEENIQSNNRQILANEESQAAALEQQRQAQAIIDQNDAELADDTLPDSRRAELEANNAAQRASIAENAAVIDEAQNNIDDVTANNEQQADSILTNQGVIEENAEAFSANGDELGASVVASNDTALSSILSSLGSLFNFGGKPTASSVTDSGTTTGSPVPTPDTAAIAQDAAKLRAQDPALTDDEDQNLQNVVGAQGEIVRAEENIQSNNLQISANEEAQAAALEQQRQAQAIIDQNDAELADENLPADRRAELEANNAAQRASIAENAAVIDEAQNNIDDATANNEQQADSIITNQGVIEANSEAFSASGDELGAPVIVDDDPALEAQFPPEEEIVEVTETSTSLSEEELAALFDGAEEAGADPIVEVDETATSLSEEELAALFDGAEEAADPVVEVDETATSLSEEELAALFDGAEEVVEDGEITELAEPVDPDADPEAQFPPEEDEEITELAEPVDPDADPDPELLGGPQEDEELVQLSGPEDVELSPEDVDAEIERAAAEGAEQFEATDVDPETDPDLPANEEDNAPADTVNPDSEAAASEAATRNQAQAQATYKARYGDIQRTPDWRVRLSLAPGAQYLYNDPSVELLKPLSSKSGTNGVIFPYTPTISTTYSANYEQYDLTHSNYRGIFYKSSRVGDISVRGTFTAQDTQEANYMLAVIHFFRSVTKMFYGQDAQRGAPPPICYLNGFGQYQFSNHPVVVSSFNYTLPNDVDYIRTTSPNNFGLNLLDRYNQTPAPSTAGSGPLAGLTRLTNALLPKAAENIQRGPANAVPGMVNNQTPASYVPTKMEIDITLIPVQSRSQISQQFSLQGFANGDLLKGGFW